MADLASFATTSIRRSFGRPKRHCAGARVYTTPLEKALTTVFGFAQQTDGIPTSAPAFLTCLELRNSNVQILDGVMLCIQTMRKELSPHGRSASAPGRPG